MSIVHACMPTQPSCAMHDASGSIPPPLSLGALAGHTASITGLVVCNNHMIVSASADGVGLLHYIHTCSLLVLDGREGCASCGGTSAHMACCIAGTARLEEWRLEMAMYVGIVVIVIICCCSCRQHVLHELTNTLPCLADANIITDHMLQREPVS